jgi:ligand-binding sensor domain-containing protein/signal transduction histidine kinase
MRIYILFFLNFFGFYLCNAQAYFAHYAEAEGLTDQYIYTMSSDNNDFLMVGTGQGVAVLTHNFEPYNSSTNIVQEPTTAIYKTKTNGTWIGTQSGRLYKSIKNTERFAKISIKSAGSSPIKTIFETPDGSVWVVHQAGVVVRIQGRQPTIFRCQSQAMITDMAHIGGNDFAIATNSGLCIARVVGNKMTHAPIAALPYHFTCIEPKTNGDGWYAGTKENGFFDFDNATKYTQYTTKNGLQSPQITDIKQRNYRTVQQKHQQELWVATNTSIEKYVYINALSPQKHQHTATYASKVYFDNAKPNALYIDAQQQLWIGTYGAGIYLFEGDAIAPKNTALKNITNIIYTPQGYWYANTQGLHHIDTALQKTRFITNFFDDKITALAYDSLNACVWVGSVQTGLHAYNTSTYARINPPNPAHSLPNQHINDLKPDTKGGVWAATAAEGLFYINPKKQIFGSLSIKSGLATNAIKLINTQTPNVIYADVLGQGVVRIANVDFDNPQKPYTLTTIPNTDTINIIHLEKYNNALLLCTEKNGILEYNNNKTKIFLTNNTAKNIYKILYIDQNQLWFATKKGLIKYDATQNPSYKFYKINNDNNPNDPPNNLTLLKTNDNKSVFVDNSRIYTYTPQNDGTTNNQAPIFIQQILIDNKKITYKNDKIALPYGNYDISITAFLLSYPNQARNMYEYTLQGKSLNKYTKTKENTIKYLSLPPGEYTLKIQGIAQNGFVPCSEKTIHISVDTPFYRQWWALSAILISIFLLLSGGYFLYEKQQSIISKNIQKQYEENQKTHEKIIKKQENEFDKLNDINYELHRKITQVELKNQELTVNISQSALEIQETSREFAAYVYRTSHDLNGPIARIEGLMDLHRITNDIKYITQNLEEPIKELRSKFNELHEIVKMQERKPKIQEINIATLINTAIEIFDYDEKLRAIRYNKPIKIETNTDIKTKITSDPEIISNTLHELLKNAMQHTKNTISATHIQVNVTETNQNWQIDVIDNGEKITDYIITNMFTMFYKGTTQSKGMGVGLTKARSAMRCIEGNMIYNTSHTMSDTNAFSMIIKKPIVKFGFDL